SSLRRGILHNAVQLDDGSWQWRWARHRQDGERRQVSAEGRLYDDLWADLTRIDVPLLLVRGLRPDSVLGDDDETRLVERVPHARIVRVAEAGHSIQGDAPVQLARIIDDFVASAA
ncbi:MAG TPA: alpha/beta hydrolase, partial [Mycobacteriales bacterium]|nr:alpha/beta hydrolase [Mycobacteriales bacterium]